MSVQDDRREIEQIELFGLDLPNDKSRSGTDAILEIDGKTVEFELKSTTKNSVTTVRDFGLDHLEKWVGKHWLFGFYTAKGNALMYTRYASAEMMKPWIESKRKYIEADFKLSSIAPSRLTLADLYSVVGEKRSYSLEDAQFLHKKQLNATQYQEMKDLQSGFSPERMLELLKLRCRYVLRRGSTLNNPHIPKATLEKFPKITDDHSKVLRTLVAQSLKT